MTSFVRFTYMPKLPKTCSNDSNMSILDEGSYDSGTLLETIDRDVPKMNDEQRNIYDEIVSVVSEERGGMFFAYGFGGTGKTFIWRLLSASIRSQGKLFLILHQMRVLLCCYKAVGQLIQDLGYHLIQISFLHLLWLMEHTKLI